MVVISMLFHCRDFKESTFFSEKTVCLGFSTGNSSAQSIIHLISSNVHHGLSARPEHLQMPTAFVHVNLGFVRTWVRDFETQWEFQNSGYPSAQPRLPWLNLWWPHSCHGITSWTCRFYNSRSGASSLSLHHSSQKSHLSAKSKIKKEKRKVKNLITRTRTQVSPPPSQKRCH